MYNQPDIITLSKSDLLSELNALNYSNWTREDMEYRDKLEAEYHKRIEDECKFITKEE